MATDNLSNPAQQTDLQRAYGALLAKAPEQDKLWAYYDGAQPVVYANHRLRQIFPNLDARFCENWCAVVVDSLKDRINLTGLHSEDAAADEALQELWDSEQLNLASDDVHEACLVAGEGYLLAWIDPAGERPEAYPNDPRLCHVQYDPERPREALWAAKQWLGEDGKLHLTLYYPDRLEYYHSRKPADQVQDWRSFEESQAPAENPYGVVPVFHFRAQRRAPKSELQNIISLQDAVNKLLVDMMVGAEFGAFPQRYVISRAEPGEVGTLKNAPWEIWSIPAGDGMGQSSSVGEFSATDLGNYLGAIDNLSGAIATISRTPRHYFFGDGGAMPSGEALIAMEAPLNKKAQDRIDALTPTWQQAAAFLLQLRGIDAAPSSLIPVFDRPETIQPRTAAEIMQMRVASGMPLVTALRLEGMEQAELDQLQEDQQAEDAARPQVPALGWGASVAPLQAAE